MPLIRRIPKRGFNNARHATVYIPVNLESLNVFEDGAKVDFAALKSVGLANGKGAGIKILGGGEVTKKLSVTAHAFSAAAKAKIEAKGGTCELIVVKKAEPAKAEIPDHFYSGCAGDLPVDRLHPYPRIGCGGVEPGI